MLSGASLKRILSLVCPFNWHAKMWRAICARPIASHFIGSYFASSFLELNGNL